MGDLGIHSGIHRKYTIDGSGIEQALFTVYLFTKKVKLVEKEIEKLHQRFKSDRHRDSRANAQYTIEKSLYTF